VLELKCYLDLNPLIRYLEAVNDDNAWALGLKLIEGMVKAEGLRLLRVEKGHCSQADLLPLIRDLEEDDTQSKGSVYTCSANLSPSAAS